MASRAGGIRSSYQRPAHGRRLALVLRAEKLTLDAGERAANTLEADVIEVVYQGNSVRIDLRLPDGEVVTLRELARAGNVSSWPVTGDRVRLAFDPADTLLVPAPAFAP